MADYPTTVYLTDGRELLPNQIEATSKGSNGWLTVKKPNGTFVDYPPHMVQEVRREVGE
jgi:hypothetical protein